MNQLLCKELKAFAEFIATQILEKEILVSFDVVFLFTYMPTGLAVQLAYQILG